MAESPAEYLAANAPYPGVVKSLQRCLHQLYIASSKKENRVARLVTDLLHLDGFGAGSAWLFAGLLPPNEEKARVLQYATLARSVTAFYSGSHSYRFVLV